MVGHQADNVGSFKLEAACHTSTGSPTCTLMTMCTLMDREGPYSFNRVCLGNRGSAQQQRCFGSRLAQMQDLGIKPDLDSLKPKETDQTIITKQTNKKHPAFSFACTFITSLIETNSGKEQSGRCFLFSSFNVLIKLLNCS